MKIESTKIPIKERSSIVFLQYGNIDVKDGAFLLINKEQIKTKIPVANLTCLMLEPGTRISHAAISLAAEVGCLINWVGEAGVRLYSSGRAGGARADKLLYQAKLALDDSARLKIVKAMYNFRFKEQMPQKRSIEQLRGLEGIRVKEQYKNLSKEYNITWNGRNYDRNDFYSTDNINICISVANHCLYGICESAILIAGYSSAIGFIHTGKPLSFVYDIADLFKFDTVIPIAFKIASGRSNDLSKDVRIACRDSFRKYRLLDKTIPTIEEILNCGGILKPKPHIEAIEIAIPNEEELC